MRSKVPKNLHVTLRGFEETPAERIAREAAEAKAKEGEEDDDDDDTDDDDEGGEGGKGDEKTAGLKSALDKERKANKTKERELKALRKFKEEQEAASKSDTDNAKDEATKAKTKTEKLAKRLRETAIDNAIIKLASGTDEKLRFEDIDDALSLINREAIDVEQDDDDPDEIEVDEETVLSALKALAKKKPHLLQGARPAGEKSGSKFNGPKKSDKEKDEESLRKQYPALNRSTVAR